MASPELQRIVDHFRAMPRRLNPSPERMRRGFDAMSRMIALPDDVKVESLTVGGIPAERLRTPEAHPTRAVLFLHGGGFVMGSPATHRALAARVGRAAGAVVYMLEYRLAPEHPFPAAIEDTVAATRGLVAEGVAPQRLAFVGDSAGAGLAVAAMLALRDAGEPLPAAIACLSPWVDLTLTATSLHTRAELDPWLSKNELTHLTNLYLGGTDPTHPLASPILADLARLPPLLIQVGTAEVLYDDAARFAERAKQAGVDVTFESWEDMIHVWHAFTILAEAEEATTRVGQFLRKHTPD